MIKRKLNKLDLLDKSLLIIGNVLAVYNLYKNPGAFVLSVLLFALTVACVMVVDTEENK